MDLCVDLQLIHTNAHQGRSARMQLCGLLIISTVRTKDVIWDLFIAFCHWSQSRFSHVSDRRRPTSEAVKVRLQPDNKDLGD